MFAARLGLALTVALLLTSCTSVPSTGSEAISRAKDSSSAPPVVRSLIGPASCGEFVVGLTGTLPESAVDCMRNADGLESAQLVVSRSTTEGDPIVQFFFSTRGTSGFALHTDSEWDRFSDRGWSTSTCESVEDCGLATPSSPPAR